MRGCLLLVWPAIQALKGSWANNREHFQYSVAHRRAVHGASCGVVYVATLPASAARDLHRVFLRVLT